MAIYLLFEQISPTEEHMLCSCLSQQARLVMFRLVFAHAHFAFGGVGRISMQLLFAHHLKQNHLFPKLLKGKIKALLLRVYI
jgi:hypothetical protein